MTCDGFPLSIPGFGPCLGFFYYYDAVFSVTLEAAIE